MTPVSVLVVDDHPVIRHGLVSMLQTDRGITVVGSAGNGQEAMTKIDSLSPQVVLLDINMPVMDGLTATKNIKRQYPHTAVLILTLYHNEEYIIEAISSGAAGYLLKNATREEICSTIKDLTGGGVVINTNMLQRALHGRISIRTDHDPDLWGMGADFEPLTKRERQVLYLLVDGLANKEIGSRLSISEDTVKKHVQRVIHKLYVTDRTQAAVKSVRIGLVP